LKRAAIGFLSIGSALILLSFLPGFRFGPVLFAVLAVAFPVALIALGAARQGRLGPLTAPLTLLLVILEGSLVGMLILRGQVLDGPWVAGLPLAAAIQLFGMWLMPLGLVALVYAITFDSFTLREEDLGRLERLIQPEETSEREA
jgi:hypothetical protein